MTDSIEAAVDEVVAKILKVTKLEGIESPIVSCRVTLNSGYYYKHPEVVLTFSDGTFLNNIFFDKLKDFRAYMLSTSSEELEKKFEELAGLIMEHESIKFDSFSKSFNASFEQIEAGDVQPSTQGTISLNK